MNKQKSEKPSYLALIAHDLRTPLNRLMFAAEVLQENYPDLQTPTNAMLSDIEELNAMIGEILEFERLQAGQNPALNLQFIDFKQIFNNLKTNLYSLKQHAQISLNIENANLAFPLQADKKYFIRCLENLVLNANKFAEKNILFNLHYSGEALIVSIEDDGKGINPKDMANIFAPFASLDKSAVGYGLGLAIVQQICDWHGFKLSAENSASLGGAKFCVTIEK